MNREDKTPAPKASDSSPWSAWAVPAFFVGILGCVLSWFAYNDYQQVVEREFRQLEAGVRIADARATGLIRDLDRLMKEIAAEYRQDLSPAEREAFGKRLLERRKQFPEIRSLVVVDSKGQVELTSNSNLKGFDSSGRDYFIAHLDKPLEPNLYASRPFKSSFGDQAIAFSLAIRDSGQNLKGVVVAGMNPNYFDDMLRQVVPLGNGSTATLVHSKGDIINRQPFLEKYIGANIAAGKPFQDHVQSGKRISRQLGISAVDGVERMIVFSRVGETPLLVNTARPLADALAQWRGNLFARLFIFVFGTTAILIYSLISQRRARERKQAEAKIHLAASVFTHAREGIMITDENGLIVDVNDTFSRLTGFSREEAIGKKPDILRSDRHDDDFFASMWKSLIEEGHWNGEIWNRRKDNGVYAEMLTISAVRDAAGTIRNYVALFTDITAMKEHQKQLEHIAHYDVLTNLPNRVLLADRLHQAIAMSQRRNVSLAVAYLDLDGFKAINDQYGHDTGDQLLIAVSQRMKTALREGDTLSRIGGDEFVAILVDLEHAKDCEPVVDRLLEAAAHPSTIGNHVLQVSASIGVTLYPQDGADADMLLRHADQAMYQAKQAGKNGYHLFDVDHDAAVMAQRENVDRIRQGLEQHEFLLYYQPKVNMKTGSVIGAEALIRWQHPERGLLAPAAFLPAIENHPISVDLGEWVIATALGQMAAWNAVGLEIPVSVNIGARQLQQGDFVPRLRAALAAHPEVKPAQLELEILETSALEDVTKVSELMYACLSLGVGFALDDFGTGYSSLTYLKRLPADLLKIDQSFVINMIDDSEDLAIVNGVIGLATAFRRQVIAEGVETVEHGRLLLPLGCELAQGYGIARLGHQLVPRRDLDRLR